ncbi:murein hydrolase activator EnvC family protein [Microbacterium sp. E-13]|uniref:murein hydrolase activator EnvC family protein n=1 Tax=Microbacterium sp. E-13 TaxID=3404048 RepID=UPI003CF242F1
MTTSTLHLRRRARWAAAGILAGAVAAVLAQPAAASTETRERFPPPPDPGSVVLERDWAWPLHQPFRLERPFVAPAHEYGPGHRGVDLAPLGDEVVHAPAAGVVAFSGEVAGRGILTIDHGGGLVSTLEPVRSDLEAGVLVARDAPVAQLATGGHAPLGVLHFGVRRDGEYLNPLILLGGVPRAVLLPCC